MTERVNSFLVVLDRDIREDEIKHLVNAIRMIKGVVSVTPNTTHYSDVVAAQRVRHELRQKLEETLDQFWEKHTK